MQLAASIPGLDDIFSCSPVNQNWCQNGANRLSGNTQSFNSLGDLISGFLTVAIEVAGVLLIAWAFWGVFQYIFAGGNKDQLKAARNRITFSIIGFILVSLAFVLQQFFKGVFCIPGIQCDTGGVHPVLTPQGFSIIPTVYAQSLDLSEQYGFGNITSVGQAFSLLIPRAFEVASIAVVFYFLIAIFKIISAGDNKEAVGEAQRMITHSIVGFVLLMLMFILLKFITSYFGITFTLL